MRVWRWVCHHAQIVAYAILAVAIAVGFYGQERESASRARQARDTQRQACESQRDGRTVLRAVITKAFQGGQTIDLTHVPGFNDLDPATQAFFSNIAVLSAETAQSEPSQRDQLLELVPLPDCG